MGRHKPRGFPTVWGHGTISDWDRIDVDHDWRCQNHAPSEADQSWLSTQCIWPSNPPYHGQTDHAAGHYRWRHLRLFVGLWLIWRKQQRGRFFVESEPEQAIVYVRARGNLSLEEKDDPVRQTEEVVLAYLGIITAFSFTGDGDLDATTGGASAPSDSIGQVQLATIPWEGRTDRPELDGDIVLSKLQAATSKKSQVAATRFWPKRADQHPANALTCGLKTTIWTRCRS